MTALPYILLGLVVVIAAVFFWMRESAHAKTEAAYERLLNKSEEMLEAERRAHQSTTDRLHATKNLPPGAVDMTAIFEERQEERREEKALLRVNGGPIKGPRRVGKVDRVVAEMQDDVRRRRTEELRQQAAEKTTQHAS